MENPLHEPLVVQQHNQEISNLDPSEAKSDVCLLHAFVIAAARLCCLLVTSLVLCVICCAYLLCNALLLATYPTAYLTPICF